MPHRDHTSSETPQPMWRRYLRMIRPNPVADLDDELRDHIETTVERLVAGGMTPDAARAEAIRRFGDVTRVRSEVNRLDAAHETRANRTSALETFWYDVRYAARGIRRNPGFAAVAALSIALGVAANAAVFSMVNAVLLRPIPGSHADNLRRLYVNHHSPFDWTDLSWFRARTTTLAAVVGERQNIMSFRGSAGAEIEPVHISYVTAGFFKALGARTALGVPFDVDETKRLGADPVAVLTYRFWQRRFGGDSTVIGRQVMIAEHAFTVVGVADADFRSSVMLWAPDAFIPVAMAPVLTGQRLDQFGGSFYTTVRLAPGATDARAQAELNTLMAQLARSDSARYEGRTVRLGDVRGVNAEMHAGVTAGSVFLMGMVAMVLLIACANVANLLLGRAEARRTEIGVRLAIGASRRRLVRQLLTESLLLALIGTAVGFAVAVAITRVIPATLPAEGGMDSAYFAPDARVITYTALLCLATTVLFGLAPALRTTSPDLTGMLKGTASPRRRKRRGALVVAQSSLCVVLLAVASLFLRGLASARGVNPGFSPDGLIDVSVDTRLLPRRVDDAEFFDRVLTAASALPGVQSATLAGVVPLTGSNMETSILPEGMTVQSRRDQPHVYFNVVAPRFFETERTPILRGREFAPTDRANAPLVAIVNATAARRIWPDGDALGKRFDVGGDKIEIVGIAGDANYVMPGEAPKPTVYFPFAQMPRGDATLQLRTNANVATTRKAVWEMMKEIAPGMPPVPVVRMADDMGITLLPVRAGAVVLGAFGLVALLLASAGIYGVASYSVASRTREIGVRAALGANRARLVRMVLAENGRRVIAGAVLGLAITVAIAWGLSRVIYGVQAVDPVVLGGVALVMGVVAVLATLIPARRAAAADPVSAMRTN